MKTYRVFVSIEEYDDELDEYERVYDEGIGGTIVSKLDLDAAHKIAQAAEDAGNEALKKRA